MYRTLKSSIAMAGLLFALPQLAYGQVLSLDIEAVRVENVGAAWITVDLQNTYTDAVVACTYNLPSSSDPTATVRLQNVGTTSFDVRIQQFENNNTVTASDVHCLIVDSGAYTLPDGLEIEAYTVVSDQTAGLNVPGGWGIGNLEDVTSTLTHSYSDMVVLGQVMTFNDVNASVIFTNNCTNRGTRPSPARFCVGKHIGQINNSRAPETIGYIVADAKIGTLNDVAYRFSRGADQGGGVGNNPPNVYSVGLDYDTGVMTQAAEDGGQGGWAVLYGNDPLPNNALHYSIDEEVVAGDTTRTHTSEEMFYALFQNNQTANLSASKTVTPYSGSATQYYIPGSDVIYKIEATNAGTAPVDNGSLFFVDELPPEVEFYNDDIDDGGSATGSVIFTETGSGLTFDETSDLGFSDGTTRPASFADCNYTPTSGYDSNVNFVCFNPKGRFKAGSLVATDPIFAFEFRVRLN